MLLIYNYCKVNIGTFFFLEFLFSSTTQNCFCSNLVAKKNNKHKTSVIFHSLNYFKFFRFYFFIILQLLTEDVSSKFLLSICHKAYLCVLNTIQIKATNQITVIFVMSYNTFYSFLGNFDFKLFS